MLLSTSEHLAGKVARVHLRPQGLGGCEQHFHKIRVVILIGSFMQLSNAFFRDKEREREIKTDQTYDKLICKTCLCPNKHA